MTATGFSDKGRARVWKFVEDVTGCEITSKQVDAYFDDISNFEDENGAHIEISRFQTLSGNPETLFLTGEDFKTV